eukprot:TRINITY_DN36822_c0_g1_i1.p2 TRINITY_DN36822_c0_g1~~TRINITY_DN36822_c0_g1_i1.p2  ORF type:complete len:132 (-),score=5.61 TRINITY_DN36822_c0_g1_i1:80-475(-)
MVEICSNRKTSYKQLSQSSLFKNFAVRSRSSQKTHTTCVGWQCSGVEVRNRAITGFKHHQLDYKNNFRRDLKIRLPHRIRLQARPNNQSETDRRLQINQRPQVPPDEDYLNEQTDQDDVEGDQLFFEGVRE